MPASVTARNSMLDCIFDQCLQQQRRHLCVQQASLDVDFKSQSLLKLQGFQREIAFDQIDFISQAHRSKSITVHQASEERGEVGQSLPGSLNILKYERADIVERVEQEMGVDLASQELQLDFPQANLVLPVISLGGAALSPLGAQQEDHAPQNQDYGRVHDVTNEATHGESAQDLARGRVQLNSHIDERRKQHLKQQGG